jgi:signal transduction histidine kinase
MRFSKVLLILITLAITIAFSRGAIMELYYLLMKFIPFTSKALLIIPKILLAFTGAIASLTHYKSYQVSAHLKKNIQEPYSQKISKIYWIGTIGFALTWLAFVVFIATQMEYTHNSFAELSGIILGIFLFVAITIWTIRDLKRIKELYVKAQRTNESVLNEIGKE